MPAPHPWALPSTPAWVWLQDGTLLRQHSTAHASTVVGAFTSTLDHCTHHRTPAASRMGAMMGGIARSGAPLDSLPRGAACGGVARRQELPLRGRSAPSLGGFGVDVAPSPPLRSGAARKLWRSCSDPCAGSATWVGFTGELGTSNHANASMGRRVAPCERVAAGSARDGAPAARRREGR